MGDVADVVGGGTPSTTVPDYWDGDINWYTPAEVGSTNYTNESKRKLTKLGLEKSSAKLLPVNTILFTSRAGIGKTTILLNESATNQRFQSIVPKKESLKTYFTYSMTSRIKMFALRHSSGSTFLEISGKELGKMPIKLPCLIEQEKIGEFVKSIDSLISLHQRELLKITQFKNTMLQKMFPSYGKSVPEIRFEGFKDEWKKVELGSLGHVQSNGVDKKIVETDEYVYLLNYMDVYNKLSVTIKNYKSLMSVTAKREQIKSKDVKKGDIFFTPSSETKDDIGHSMVIKEDIPMTLYSYHIMRFRPLKNTLDINFSDYFCNTDVVRNQLIFEAQGVQRYTISKFDIAKLEVYIPSMEEQVKIGNFLCDLDYKICITKSRLNKIKQIKNSMLNKLFL